MKYFLNTISDYLHEYNWLVSSILWIGGMALVMFCSGWILILGIILFILGCINLKYMEW